MFEFENKVKGIFLVIVGIALSVYAVISFGTPGFNDVLPMSLFLLTTGIGAISMGFSGAGKKGIGIIFMIVTMLLIVYCFYDIVKSFMNV